MGRGGSQFLPGAEMVEKTCLPSGREVTLCAPRISALHTSATILLKTEIKIIGTSSFVAPTVTGSVIECFQINILLHFCKPASEKVSTSHACK